MHFRKDSDKSLHLKFMGGRSLLANNYKIVATTMVILHSLKPSHPSPVVRASPILVQMCIPLAPMHYNHLGLQIRLVDAFS